MSTIPKERLEQLASGNAWYCVQDDEAAELARIALASLEAEPYGYVHKAAYEKTGSCGLSNDREAYRYSSTHVAVYTAPPAPVSVPDAMEMDDDFDSAFEHGKAVGWNAYRAAMLQGSQPVSQTYKLPVNTPCQDAPAHIWLQTAGVWPEDGELSELTWCSHNQHHDDTLYVRADLVNGNSPVTPDGWINCSERMPDDGQHVIILCDGAFVLYAQYRDGEFFDIVRNGDEFFETQSRNVTDWMRLPEPPQEVNRG
ncbi:putative phage protein [Escherichia coli]|uniref:DUF551 domain-containing protein n=1 Tax=Escherichia coli TaxID=562 RepID=UPI0010CC3C86|nr:DUF551 domain-containing protein [Escherichia coli]GDS22847.1 putative phage protein [Escherichia coli]